ncbi:unnamed protein product (macronuclear) [Paramecium tetraurelia]|uniref:MSP domain-containing protein n=1 Tax=Paramecium tetraurelia TaxID=5888 RepID=A0C0U8_PARTE|nr:uncharacterized protein GSPATT00033891001 [Paramecium tetraurelia]CAK64415.1 unnamed protein product [Paramecium tetraurelia]|eukprot:XP_001431813.1 hypothetical protein (macronuclear) [Paramecium tetraurelia strain d4-2]
MFSAQNKLTFAYNRNTLQVQTEFKMKNISENILEIQIELSNPQNYKIYPNNFYIQKQETKVVEIIQINYVPMRLDERAKIMYRTIMENSTTSRKNTQTIYHFYKYFFFELSCHKQSSFVDDNSRMTQVRQQDHRQHQVGVEVKDSLNYWQLVTLTVSIIVIIIAVCNWLYIKIIKNDQ